MKTRPRAQSGFTLIELMVASTIALVAILAGTSLFISSKQSSRVQQMQDRLTQDGRFALYMLQQVIQQAGFRDNPGNAMGTDYLTPTSAESLTVKFFGDGVSAVDCQGNLSSGLQTLTISKNGTCLQCTSGGSAATCPSTKAGTGQDWVAPVGNVLGNGSEVVDFQLQYGTDTGPATPAEVGCGADAGSGNKVRDCVPDTYVLATAQATPAQVQAVKVCLVLRSQQTNSALSRSSAVQDCSGSNIANSQTDLKMYRTFRTTVLLRNR